LIWVVWIIEYKNLDPQIIFFFGDPVAHGLSFPMDPALLREYLGFRGLNALEVFGSIVITMD